MSVCSLSLSLSLSAVAARHSSTLTGGSQRSATQRRNRLSGSLLHPVSLVVAMSESAPASLAASLPPLTPTELAILHRAVTFQPTLAKHVRESASVVDSTLARQLQLMTDQKFCRFPDWIV